jgi:hypothetical protein
MQSKRFKFKQLETIFGYYTDLMYTNCDYSSYVAHDGYFLEDPEENQILKGFVEPNIYFWDYMLYFLSYLDYIYKIYNLFQNETVDEGRLDYFIYVITNLREISLKELSGQYLSVSDYNYIKNLTLSDYGFRVAGLNSSKSYLIHQNSIKIADIIDFKGHSANEKITNGAGTLYGAIGLPSIILVLVGNENTNRITVGVAYNHYEFVHESTKKLTDCDWVLVADDRNMDPDQDCLTRPSLIQNMPPKNFWYDGLR